jgi:hypothetical protein
MNKIVLLLGCFFVLTSQASASTAESEVRRYFADIPVMIEIARCESNFRQFSDNGAVLRGGTGDGMIGVFQFFESIHGIPASRLGYDISTLDGNLEYARHLYETEGTTPWNNARTCWEQVTSEPSNQLVLLRQRLILLQQLLTLLEQKQLVLAASS